MGDNLSFIYRTMLYTREDKMMHSAIKDTEHDTSIIVRSIPYLLYAHDYLGNSAYCTTTVSMDGSM